MTGYVPTTVDEVAEALPDIETLRSRCRALAILDAILSPEWESRYYSFDAAWGIGEQMASMNNGSGDEYSIVFSPAGVFIRGFDHESKMSPFANDGEVWPGLLDGLPEVFARQATEPAFSFEGGLCATCCIWRETHDSQWRTGPVDLSGLHSDGSQLLRILCDGTGAGYRSFAADYYEVDLDQTALAHVYAGLPLTEHIVGTLNPDVAFAEVLDELMAIGMPGGAPERGERV